VRCSTTSLRTRSPSALRPSEARPVGSPAVRDHQRLVRDREDHDRASTSAKPARGRHLRPRAPGLRPAEAPRLQEVRLSGAAFVASLDDGWRSDGRDVPADGAHPHGVLEPRGSRRAAKRARSEGLPGSPLLPDGTASRRPRAPRRPWRAPARPALVLGPPKSGGVLPRPPERGVRGACPHRGLVSFGDFRAARPADHARSRGSGSSCARAPGSVASTVWAAAFAPNDAIPRISAVEIRGP